MNKKKVKIIFAKKSDIPEVLKFINELAAFEKLEHEVVVTEKKLAQTLFGKKKYAEVIFLKEENNKVGFALFFHNYSTFLGKPGIYLEDLYVRPEFRGKGYGKALLAHLAKLSLQRGSGRLEWGVLNWNQPALEFYKTQGAISMSEWTVQRVTGQALINLAAHAIL